MNAAAHDDLVDAATAAGAATAGCALPVVDGMCRRASREELIVLVLVPLVKSLSWNVPFALSPRQLHTWTA